MADEIDLLQIKIEKAKAALPEETLNAISAVDWRSVILGMRASKGYSFEQLGDLEIETELLLCGLLPPAEYPKELERRMGISKTAANDLVNEMNTLVFKKIKEELIKNSERKKIFAKKESVQSASKAPETKTEAPAETIIQKNWEVGTTTPKASDSSKNATVSGEIKQKEADMLQSAGIEVFKAPKIVTENLTDANVTKEKRADVLRNLEKPELLPASNVVHPVLQQKVFESVKMPTVKTEYSMENLSKTEPVPKNPINKSPDPYRLSPDE